MQHSSGADDPFARVFDLSGAPDATAHPIIKLTDLILDEALKAGAAQVHLAASGPNVGSVRWFVQGEWHEVMRIPACSRVVNRLKIMGNLDISKKGRQEGTVHVRVEGRVVHLPIVTNERLGDAQEAFVDCR